MNPNMSVLCILRADNAKDSPDLSEKEVGMCKLAASCPG